MAEIKESGFYYPNKMVLMYLLSIEETIGQEALKGVLKLAGIPAKKYPPPNDFAKTFDFAYFGAIGGALEKLYGSRGERGLSFQAGRITFSKGLAEYGALIGVSDLAIKLIPTHIKAGIGLKAMGETFNKFSDQIVRIEEKNDHFLYIVERCPVCWGRESNRAVCYSGTSMIEEGLKWVTGGQIFPIEEISCIAKGNENCTFYINKTSQTDINTKKI